MMHLAYDGDARIQMRTRFSRGTDGGIELLITHTTGVRGEKVRSGTYAHVYAMATSVPQRLRLARGFSSRSHHTSHWHMSTHAWAWVCVNMTPKNFGRSRLL